MALPAGFTSAPSMQEAILRLTEFWADQGCVIMQPYNTEVGAGTLNPATFLRVLGPEPWRVAYVEPSVRPDDSRYGDNPNRIQTHTQYQVILKPEPGDAQERYLASLSALGIDLAAHDVRFVEDNWASPALGAWGLGWEVWLDGLEITQFTYFQQAGGFSLEPVSVEITYGLERILMALQGVNHFKQIAYADGLAYGDVFGQFEYEWSRYYLDDADVDAVGRMFAEYEAEAKRLIELRLPVPAYSYVLKCSHTFNVLDARGAISPTERARSFARMRRLAHQVAELWIERRQEEGFPLGRWQPPERAAVPRVTPAGEEEKGTARLVFEIGTEELPAGEVTSSAEAVRQALINRLAGTRLAHGEVTVHASPRRIVTVVDGVAAREEDSEETRRGPRHSAAFDPGGRPTPAAEGFARANGVKVEDLISVEVKGVRHVAVVRHIPGRPAPEVLAGVLSSVVGELRSADTNMRWDAPNLSFIRPVRWLLAVLGEQVVPFAVSNLASGRTTRVDRNDAQQTRSITGADDYAPTLRDAGIVVDAGERRSLIAQQAEQLAKADGGTADLEPALLEEVANLVEAPNAILGRFDRGYLDLPPEILVTVMRKHQRYFPVRGDDGSLLPAFIAVANGPCDADLVRAGNESVLRARYEDARFFWAEDLQRRPDEMRSGLDRLTFAEKLGSMGDRAGRIGAVAVELLRELGGAGTGHLEVLQRAAALVKFDLASHMVTELTSLAGVMAREYALRAGEDPAVAEALFEQELPRHSADALPHTIAGAVLSVANRADLLAGLFAAGADPSGSSDPFGLRRAALGLLAVLEAHPELEALTVDRALDLAGAAQPIEWTPGARERVLEFVARRWETQQLDSGRPAGPVRAVLPSFGRPAAAQRALGWLVQHRDDPRFATVAQALGRAARIVPPGTAAGWDPAAPAEPAEAALREAVRAMPRGGTGDLPEFVAGCEGLVGPIDRFFDEVLVMVDDRRVRENRLGLLATIRDAAQAVIDWTALE